MNKDQAAAFLGVSTRTLQRYTTQAKIGVTYRHGKTGAEADYDEEQLRLFKETLENTTYQPASSDPSQALAPIQTRGVVSNGADRLAAALEALQPNVRPPVPIESKLLIKLDEASALTGLSRATLRVAIDQKKLKARIMGRAWRIKRTDLDLFISNL
jgi:excisionase family DNA binding protein